MALPSFLVSALNAILASFSQTYVVVLGVYYKLQTFLYLTANGMIQGMRPIMSYNYGAKESARVRKIYLMTFEIVVGIMAVGTVICFVMPQTLMSMFTSNPETLISKIDTESAKELFENGIITGGMIPKVKNCLEAVQNDVKRVHILDGRLEHSLLIEIFTKKGVGTMIKK